MANLQIKDLPPTSTQARTDVVAAQKNGGTTNKLSIAQILGLIQAGDFQAIFHALTAKTNIADADEFTVGDSAASFSLKRVTLSNLIASIFKTARTISNAQFATATFKLFNAAGTPRALMFDTSALTGDRTALFPDWSPNLSFVSRYGDVKSAPQTVTLGGLVTFPHGLGFQPDVSKLFGALRCSTAISGWLVGEETPYTKGMDTNGSTNGYGFMLWADTTNVYARVGDTGVGVLANKGTGSGTFSALPANFQVIVGVNK